MYIRASIEYTTDCNIIVMRKDPRVFRPWIKMDEIKADEEER